MKNLKEYLVQHEGKDIYIRINNVSGEQTETVIKKYAIKELGDNRWALIGDSIQSIIINTSGTIRKHEQRLILDCIEIENDDSEYHIYSMDNIDIEAEQKWKRGLRQAS